MTSPSTLVDRLAHWAATTPDAPASAFDYNDPVISAIVVTKLISA